MDQAVSTLVVAISPEWQVLLPSQRYTRMWLQETIRRAESDGLLSRATRALSLLYLGITAGAHDMVLTAKTSYISTLEKMQGMISDGVQAVADIQSAAMLLTFFELLHPSSHLAWMQHAGGVASIMKIRGPRAFAEGFDRISYMAMRNYLISDAVITGKPCFLEDACWLELDKHAQDPPEMMFKCHVKLPRLLHDIQNTIAGQSSPHELLVSALNLREEMLCCFRSWILSQGSLAIFRPSYETSGSLRGYAYRFPELQSLILYCSHYASLIIVNYIIVESCEENSPFYVDECEQAAAEIAGCVDQSQSSLLTSLSLNSWLQAAAHGCAPSEAFWFATKIQQLNSTLRL